mmetsp:Transcript_372/g.574  ORF Transcript_372/g.574 Transcript_372/m.574 type:complete len:395 (-) Transcript_372:235-1419(-)
MSVLAAGRVAETVVSHAWNKDYTQVAICANENVVYVYAATPDTPAGQWKLLHTLQEHDQHVSSVDWAPTSNLIVTCSHDRNAYVWNHRTDDTWQPNLVILRLNRAALSARWSPLGNKFAITSGAKSVCICYYEEDNNWWVSKLIKKRHDSTVLSVSWHPSNVLLATTSSDFKCRVFTAQVKGTDDAASAAAWLGDDAKFGECLFEICAGGWVHAAAWSLAGTSLAFTSHDCITQFIDGMHGPANTWAANLLPAKCVALPEGSLPLRDLTFLSDNIVVAAGYDCTPVLFEANVANQVVQSWSFKAALGGRGRVDGDIGDKGASRFTSSLAVFKAQSDLGLASCGATGPSSAASDSPHDNCVQCIRSVAVRTSSSQAHVGTFTTSGLDGRVVLWEV